MEAWQEKRSIQTMNLRSVFTAEQQRVLERYYDNGMTNQSKSCFQLILQCAQETKLDFSVVRTWVGNKRRKLASKADQNGGMVQGPTGLTLAGGVGPLLTAEMAAARGAHLLPPPVSSSSSSSSPSSSCSPQSGSGSGNNSGGGNNDVIVTGIYSLARAAGRSEPPPQHAKVTPKALPLLAEPELPILQIPARPPLQAENPPLHTRVVTVPRKPPQLGAACGPPLQVRKPFSPGEPPAVSRTWAKQFAPPQPHSWPFPSQSPSQSQSQSPSPSATAASHAVSRPCATESGVRVQQVFSLAALGEGQLRPISGSSPVVGPSRTRPSDTTGCFSIAMETGNADDEYAREEELANMGAQIQICPLGGSSASGSSGSVTLLRRDSPDGPAVGRNLATIKPPGSDILRGKGTQTPPSLAPCPPRQSFPGVTPRGSYTARPPRQDSPQGMPNFQQVAGNAPTPWISNNFRKRTLQDRTQFSDMDLHTLKRYWDKGMTSLGSLCREKISAASLELCVDSEIIKTWIGNRRRKYRLMGIEIPPPKGGPAIFTSLSEARSPCSLISDGADVKTPEPGDDGERIDEVSICLSEDGMSDAFQGDEGDEDGDEEANGATLGDSVKIEIIDEEEEFDGNVSGSDMEHTHNLLEFKQEEVRYLESELENQKQKYYKLQNFTRNLLSAMKSQDTEKQQELLASLPQEVEEDWALTSEREGETGAPTMTIHRNSSVSEETGDQGDPL